MKKSLFIVDLSVEKRVTITMLVLIVMVFGFLSLSRLGLDLLPDISFPMCMVTAQYTGSAPEEIEQMITEPLEGQIASVNGIKRISSQSAEGISMITVEFEWGTNLDFGVQDIKDRIDFIRDFLPAEMTEPMIFKFNVNQMPVMFLGVSGMADTYTLRRFLDDNVKERFQRLDGVAQAAVMGGRQREIHVAIDPGKLSALGQSVDNIIMALRSQNINTPAGYVVSDQTDILLRGVGQFESVDDIRNAIVGATAGGTPVRVYEIAAVRETFRDQRSVSRMDGGESVFIIFYKRSGANTLQVSRRIRAELDAVKGSHPELKFTEIFDQGRPIEKVSRSTAVNAIIGGVLAIVFMLAFLMNIRPTIIIALAIPLSIVTTFIILYMGGFTLNMMTLGGLALGVGMLVDNAVVVIENIYRRLELGESRVEAARNGTTEVGMAITASTLTTIIVFLPILFSRGLASILTRGLSLTIMFSLLASLFVALTIVPMMASVIFKDREHSSAVRWFDPLRDRYAAILGWTLDNPWKTLLAVAAALLLSVLLAWKFMGTEFMPEFDNNMLILNVEMPMGTPLSESEKMSKQLQEMVSALPEVTATGEIIGRDETDRGGGGSDMGVVTGPQTIQIFVRLLDAGDRKRSLKAIQEDIRARLPQLRDTRIRFMSMGGFGTSEKPVKINVYGKNLTTIQQLCDNIVSAIGDVPGLKDIESSFSKGRPEFHFVVDRQKAMMYGLAPYTIQNALKTANLGTVTTQLRTGDEEINVRVILDSAYRADIDFIKQLPLRTPSGATIPLSQVVSIKRMEGPTVINRSDQYRVGIVDANLGQRPLGLVVGDVKARLARLSGALPSGYWIDFKGQYEQMQEAFGQLALALLISILLVYMVMASQFESLVHPFVIMFTIPLAIIGVLYILVLSGTSFSVAAFVGVIILAGIVVNNGIVFIDFVNQQRREGMAMREAVLFGGRSRLRPILITAGTTVMGMVPMALSRAEGSELSVPMALTIIGGLFTSTVLTLFVIPVIYQFIDRAGLAVKRRVKRIIH